MTTVDHRPDLAIKNLVVQALTAHPGVDTAHIGVAVDRGAVMLSGVVEDYQQRLRAEHVTLRVKGVRGVDDAIEVLGAERVANSLDTAKAVYQALASAVNIPVDSVHAVVVDHAVTLSGTVRWRYQSEAAAHAVGRVRGVATVVNSIDVVPEVPAVQTEEAIRSAFARNALLRDCDISVIVDGATVSLHGVVHSFAERRAANTAAWRAPGVIRVNDSMTIAYQGDDELWD